MSSLGSDPRIFLVEWREENRKIVEAKSPRQAIGVALPEWDTDEMYDLKVTELVPKPSNKKLRGEGETRSPYETTIYGYPAETILTLIYEAKAQRRL